jgi:hypothetical protein
MSVNSINFHDDRPRRRGPHAAPCPRPSARREEEELPPNMSHKSREAIELPPTPLPVSTIACNHSIPLVTLEKVLALHGPAKRTSIMKITSDPVVGISGDLLSNTVTLTLRQTYYSDEDEG